ncbi:MAG: hypothetical protein SO101_11410 [Lachnospiraceae bacterium]|nr:hypothetical protein [Lachnospiraceae bacterium]
MKTERNTEQVKRHLTQDDFIKWDSGLMSPEEMESFLSHTASCSTCADSWMVWMENPETEALSEPPAYLAEEIIGRSRQPDLMIARKLHRTSAQLRLLTYSLKVGTAVVLSIMMLFSINLTGLKLNSRLENQENQRHNSKNTAAEYNVTDYMSRGTRDLMKSLDTITQSLLNFNFSFNQEDN